MEVKDANPLITIAITCFNAEATIERAVSSALSQTWKHREIIIVDDYSTDMSWSILNQLAEKFPELIILRNQVNKGAAFSRNRLVDHANGDYIAFFDDDDLSDPERIFYQYQAIQAYKEKSNTNRIACFVSGVRRYTNGYEYPLEAIGSREKVPYGETVANYLLFNSRNRNFFYGSGTPTCCLMIGLEFCHELSGFDESLRRVEDVDFAIRFALSGGHFIGCPQNLLIQYATNSDDKTPQINLNSELSLIDKHKIYLQKHHRYKYAKRWFKIRYYHFTHQRVIFILSLFWFLICFPISGSLHLLRSGPMRIIHERRMRS